VICTLPLLVSCESASSLTEVIPIAPLVESSSARNDVIALGSGFTAYHRPFDVTSEADRERAMRVLMGAWANSSPEQRQLLAKSVAKLKSFGRLGAYPEHSGPGSFTTTDDRYNEPSYVTYMNWAASQNTRGYLMFGVSMVYTDHLAKITHKINYAIGGTSLRYGPHPSPSVTGFHKTEIPIDCTQPTLVSGETHARYDWSRPRMTPGVGHGILGTQECNPNQPPREIAHWDQAKEDGSSGGGAGDCRTRTCYVRYWYYKDTGEVFQVDILSCWCSA
jgi:hypothetical protein